MNKGNVRRFTVLGILALPLLALAVVVMVLAWGHSASQPTEAADNTNGSLVLAVKGGKTCLPGDTADYCVTTGASFELSVEVVKYPGTGYYGLQAWVNYGNALTYKKPTTFPDDDILWGCTAALVGGQGDDDSDTNNDRVSAGCLTDLSLTETQFTGNAYEFTMNCTQADSVQTITLIGLGVAPAGTLGSGFVSAAGQFKANDSITVHCMDQPTDTPTPTATDTATPTDTPTPTNTPAAPTQLKAPAIQNLFLTRQGAKIPPATCETSNDVAVFNHEIDLKTTALDPKGSGDIQQLGAFEFEVRFDEKLVCVNIEPGLLARHMICTIEDKDSSLLDGIARIGCVTQGKNPDINVDGLWNISLAGIIDCSLYSIESPKGVLTMYGLVAQGMGCDSILFTAPIDFMFQGPYDNKTGEVAGVIPCSGENPDICTEDGSIVGTFSKDGDSLDAIVNLGVFVNAPVTGARKSRPLDLAVVSVRPEPEVYSQVKANQDNGITVQLLNQDCKLADQQGHPIETLACDDADLTIRYLEGDVEPDCVVDSIDTQAIAFRWGSSKGTLIYNDRFNLEPSGAQADDDIDINDLQFVYGRFGSACGAEHPPQPPVNPKS